MSTHPINPPNECIARARRIITCKSLNVQTNDEVDGLCYCCQPNRLSWDVQIVLNDVDEEAEDNDVVKPARNKAVCKLLLSWTE